MIEATIKSRPVYGKLKVRPGGIHLFVADEDGIAAILDMAHSSPPRFFDSAQIDYIAGGDENRAKVEQLGELASHSLRAWKSIEDLLAGLVQTLSAARMDTHLYLAGTEGLIGRAMQVALEAGMDHRSISTEHRGSLARRVQCVHCKGITENVTTQPARCARCGLTLLVRDHYSRRAAAFQGVCIDAEEPGVVPPVEVVFP